LSGVYNKERSNMMVRNYEIGVIQPGIRKNSESGQLEVIPFPLPYQSPPESYKVGDLPWMQESYYRSWEYPGGH
jgi:hypothetical protein